MLLQCPVSLGEVVDKLAILKVKGQFIRDREKLAHIATETEYLEKVLEAVGASSLRVYLHELVEVNTRLWCIEDDIREKEKAGDFGEAFISLARSVYKTNDERFALKKKINEQFGSELQEVKSYAPYP